MWRTTIALTLTLLALGPCLARAADVGPVGWWKLDETSGTTAADSSPNGSHGAVMGDAQWTAGQINGALQCDGTDDYVDLPISPLIGSLGDCTLAIWANWSGQGGAWQRIWDIGTGTTFNMFLTPNNGATNTVRFAITISSYNDEDQATASQGLSAGWHHIAVTMDAENGVHELYIDGQSAATNTTARYFPRDLGQTTQHWLARSEYSADPYFGGAIDDFRIYDRVLTASEIASVMAGKLGGSTAGNPSPADGATDVLRETNLSWVPGETAATHDVYLGTVFDDVETAETTNPLNVLVSPGQDANTYDPPDRLDLGQIYYWRVDEVNAAPDYTVFRGEVWSFTVEPYAYPIEHLTATASSSNSADMGPEKTIDGSGLNAADEHSTDPKAMWLSAETGPQPTWIQYAFDRAYKLDQMLIWNSNQVLESILGIGARDVTVEYSTDAVEWTVLGDFEFTQARGEEAYTADTRVDFDGTMARYVKLTMNSNWAGILPQYGLSEVRFLAIPVFAREPEPAAGETGVNPQVAFGWRPGREAASHEVYLSSDEQAVIDGTALETTVSQPSHEASLGLSETYYWKIVEVNEAETPTSWASEVWSFSTSDYVVVDDFESYTDDIDAGQTIWQTWSDGLEDAQQNGGSQVGYDEAPFAERSIVHSGRQSMPLAYNNTTGTFSQTVRTFDSPQNWTRHGVTSLVLFFHGDPDNAPAPLYAKINDMKVVYNNGSAATAMPLWKQWTIDLASVGVNLTSITSLTIGVGNGAFGGTGTLYIDNIRLYETAPAVVAPADPGSDGLVVQYSMEGNVQDGSGNGNHGTPVGEPIFVDGPAGYGQVLNMDGTNDHVELPIGSLVGTWRDITVAAHVNQADATRLWQRVLDIGTGATVYMFLTPNNGTTNAPRFAITTAGGGANESLVTAPAPLSEGWHHLAIVIDSASMTLQLYVDGERVADGPTALLPADLGVTTQNWLGRSQYEADPYFMGLLDEFRIYDRALSASEIRYLAGDR